MHVCLSLCRHWSIQKVIWSWCVKSNFKHAPVHMTTDSKIHSDYHQRAPTINSWKLLDAKGTRLCMQLYIYIVLLVGCLCLVPSQVDQFSFIVLIKLVVSLAASFMPRCVKSMCSTSTFLSFSFLLGQDHVSINQVYDFNRQIVMVLVKYVKVFISFS